MRITVLLSRFPYPTDKGDKLRAYHQIKYLSQFHEVHLFCLSDEKVDQNHLNHVSEICESVEVYHLNKLAILFRLMQNFFGQLPFQIAYFNDKKAKKKFTEWIEKVKPNSVYTQLARMAEFSKHLSDFHQVLDYQDCFSKGLEKRIHTDVWYKKPFIVWEYKRLKKYEAEIFSYFSSCCVISKQDAQYFEGLNPENFKIIGNGIDVEYFKPTQSDKTIPLLISGNMQYPPTVQGVELIVNKVIPMLKNNYPAIYLMAAGKDPSKRVQNLEGNYLKTTGWQNDLRPYFNSTFIYCAPLQISVGLQNKILEAMAMGLPVITSSVCNKPIGAENNKHLIVADSPKEIANAIARLMENEALRTELGNNARAFVKTNFSWDYANKKLLELLVNKG